MAQSLHRATLRAAHALERSGVLARALYVDRGAAKERFWWPDRPPRIYAPRPPCDETLRDIKSALAVSKALEPGEQLPTRMGRFVAKSDEDYLRKQGCLLVAHPLHQDGSTFPVLLVSADASGTRRVMALNQRARQSLGAIMPQLPSATMEALMPYASAPLFNMSVGSREVLHKDITILTTYAELENNREVLYAKSKCVLYEALDVQELAAAISAGRCSISDCKFMVGEPSAFASLAKEVVERCWLSVVPISAASMSGYRMNGQSIALAGVNADDYEDWTTFSHAFWAEVVSSVQSGPGFQWFARYPCEPGVVAAWKLKRAVAAPRHE